MISPTMSYDFPSHESTRKRRRWGCTCGCVILLLVLAVFSSVFFYLSMKSHDPVQRYAMMDENIDGFGVLRLHPEDQGLSELTTFLFRRVEKHQANTNDPMQAKIIGLVRKVSSNFLSKMIQPEIMIYSDYNPTTADENYMVDVPLRSNFAWMALRKFIVSNMPKGPETTEGVRDFFTLPMPIESNSTSTLMVLDPKTVAFSDNEAMLRRSFDYAAQAGRAGTPSAALQNFIDQLDLDDPITGEDLAIAFVNEESRITNLINVFEDFLGITGLSDQIAAALNAQQLTFNDISGLKLTADLTSADLLKSDLTLYCASQATAQRLAKVFQAALPELTEPAADSPLVFKGTVAARDVTVVVNLELSGIKAWIEKLLPVPETAAPAQATPAP